MWQGFFGRTAAHSVCATSSKGGEMERKRFSVRPRSVLRAALLLTLSAAALDASGIALADDPPGSTSPAPIEEEEEPLPPPDEHTPNTLYADGPGEIQFEQLSPADQAGVRAAQARTETSEEVRAAYSAIAHQAAADAKVARAARQSGTNGLDDVGVEP